MKTSKLSFEVGVATIMEVIAAAEVVIVELSKAIVGVVATGFLSSSPQFPLNLLLLRRNINRLLHSY